MKYSCRNCDNTEQGKFQISSGGQGDDITYTCLVCGSNDVKATNEDATRHEEVFEAEKKEDILAKPIEIIIGPSFVESRLLVEGKNLPCTFLQVTVDVPEHTKYRASLHSLPRVDIEFYGRRVGQVGQTGNRTDSLTGYLIGEEDYEKFLEWKNEDRVKLIEERRQKSPAEILKEEKSD